MEYYKLFTGGLLESVTISVELLTDVHVLYPSQLRDMLVKRIFMRVC